MTRPLEQNPDPIFPKNILDEPGLKENNNGDLWRIAHTKSRREKMLASFLIRQGIGYYVPMLKRRQPGQKRVRYSLVPVFPGYVFFKGDAGKRYQAMCSHQIARVIEVTDQSRLLQELRQIKMVIDAEVNVYPHHYLEKGQEVRVASGPFKDLQGIIERKKGDCRLVLKVTSLFQAVAVDVSIDMVEPAGRVF
ncbi:MAG: hypothetical protein K9K64_13305 [Desulfohalobiaceae bacterium]|nr:hypothetical protein [Desulfohalobiaceae bacterium]